ncbi:MAG: hypothetical protein HOL01_16395 [Planctomycetaceae bacterium]|jgi:hypothetical protein|nr:hypothetical protein [Planctomycetaceae bacterium]MBT6496125.1 hypothetical protein [Planctomycetaceae bacterium]
MDPENKLSCPYCGGTEFQSGILKQSGNTDPIEFVSDKVESPLPRWMENLFKGAGIGGAPTRARICGQCGHVSLFVETE